jgi:uncharacterized protein YlaI
MWSNAEIMNSKGKLKRLREKPIQMPLHPTSSTKIPIQSHLRMNLMLCNEKPVTWPQLFISKKVHYHPLLLNIQGGYILLKSETG